MTLSFWTKKRDQLLQKLEGDGWSAAEIAARIGATRNAVIGRSSRLRKIKFPSHQRREAAARDQAPYRRNDQKQIEGLAIAKLRQALLDGADRTGAAAAAVADGATYEGVGIALGVSKQRVHQILALARARCGLMTCT
jgi:hypothetical protein